MVEEKKQLTEIEWLLARKERMKGFHGKYDRKTGGNKPTSRNYTFVPVKFGIPDVPEKCKPSYTYLKGNSFRQVFAGLEYTFQIVDNAVYISQHSLFVGSQLIVNAPDKFTKSKKETFCKAVIHSMVFDQDCFFEQLDRVMDRIETTIPQKEAEIITVDLVLPDELNAYTHEALTGYPEITDIDQPLENICHDDVNYNDGHDHINDELFCIESVQPILAEMYVIYQETPVIVQKISHPWLKCNIVEVCTA